MIYNSIQEFRDKATPEDKQALADYLNSSPKKSEALPNDTYKFSYTSASTYLRDEGYQVGRGTSAPKNEPVVEEFSITSHDIALSKDFIQRTVMLQKGIVDRIDKLAADNWQYSKKAILTKLLDEALKKYGY